MKICAAQLKPKTGDVEFNIIEHIKLIDKAINNDADLICFPELSLTGYEPDLANSLSTSLNDIRFAPFQKLSDENNIIICVGMPIKDKDGILIGLVIFQPKAKRTLYSKQLLHEDEMPFFVAGNNQTLINFETEIIAPAICFESTQDSHASKVKRQGTSIYLASVAKNKLGVNKGYKHYSSISNQYNYITLMSNCYGYYDNFESTGSSAIWDSDGKLIAKLNHSENGIVGIDTKTGESFIAN